MVLIVCPTPPGVLGVGLHPSVNWYLSSPGEVPYYPVYDHDTIVYAFVPV